ncbi:Cathepsin L protease [Fasciola gigantica]|uniref:Cathepsin L protease n=1 Tax=Fasciola gigantica TaxID=46835 RepID=A0A504Z4L6_FASGI|nr:Cathepsin L protease [Fasciola gigantica]
MKKYGKSVEFSKQQLVDCSRPFHNRGCCGGAFVNAFEYLKKNGLELESTYPYKAKDQKCTHDPKNAITRVKSYQGVKNGDEEHLAAMVTKFGPVSAAVNAIATFVTHK